MPLPSGLPFVKLVFVHLPRFGLLRRQNRPPPWMFHVLRHVALGRHCSEACTGTTASGDADGSDTVLVENLESALDFDDIEDASSWDGNNE